MTTHPDAEATPLQDSGTHAGQRDPSRRKPGRPSKGVTERLDLRLTPALSQLIDDAAAAGGVDRSEWLRRAALFYLSHGAPATVAQLADDD